MGKVIFNGIMLFWGILAFIPIQLSGSINPDESGYKYFKYYTHKEYDHHPQNWGGVQSKNGIIYIANQGGVLEFDGVKWRVISIPNLSARSIAIDQNGTIFVGGSNEIGYLAPDAKGSLHYVSLVKYLNEKNRNFSLVWSTHAVPTGIYFRAPYHLFYWDYKKIVTITTRKNFRTSFIINKNLYIQESSIGLARVEGNLIKPIPGGEVFKDTDYKIVLIAPFGNETDNRRLLVGTHGNGFFLCSEKEITPFPTEIDDYVKSNKLVCGIPLSSGDYALGTQDNGLVIMTPEGRGKSFFEKNYGIQRNSIKSIFEDWGENLWLCMDNGILKIEYNSPYSVFDDRCNLLGGPIFSTKIHGCLYVGTTKGLFRRTSQTAFQNISGIAGQCFKLISNGNSVLAATGDGMYEIKQDKAEIIIGGSAYTVIVNSALFPGTVWCGSPNGFIAISKDKGIWKVKCKFENVKGDIRSIIEGKNRDVWLGTTHGLVFRLLFPGEISHPVITSYDSSKGIPDGRVITTWAAERLILETDQGIYRWDAKKNGFVPDFLLGPAFAGGEKGKPIFCLVEDNERNIWFNSESRNYLATPSPNGQYKIDENILRRIPEYQVNDIYPDPNGSAIWFSSIDNLIYFDKRVKKKTGKDFPTLIRQVLVNNNEIIFDGFKLINTMGHNNCPVLEYNKRNLRFEFSSSFFEEENEIRYRCILEGQDKDWTLWNKETYRVYTNLSFGKYTFQVESKNIYGQIGKVDVFRFEILRPWYREWWAYILYISVFFLSVFLLVLWRNRKLVKEKENLANIVKMRTAEIQEKNHQLESYTVTLKEQSEKLKEMDKVKSRFFANISHEFRTPLTLIMSPLEQILSDTKDKKLKDKFKTMLRSSQQLLTLINQLLDLSRFDSGKMKLQVTRKNIVPFLKGIINSFESLAADKNLQLKFSSEESEIYLYFDSQQIEQVMNNLLGNAIKFTPGNGAVTVSILLDKRTNSSPILPENNSFMVNSEAVMAIETDEAETGERSSLKFVNISVMDTGSGISKDQLPFIFDRFYQAKSSGEKLPNGTGIGLALTKEIVSLHHGKINVHSREGTGTEFVIQLPMGREHLQEDEILLSPANVLERNQRLSPVNYVCDSSLEEEIDEHEGHPCGYENRESQENDEFNSGENGSSQEKPVILVVEDHVDVRRFICEPLREFYSVVEACDGKEGIEKAKDIMPDLIVSDIMMPGIEGDELCRILKNDIATCHIPIILLTAKASQESIILGLETGADDYVTKPFNSQILLVRIKNLIELRRQLQLKIQRQKMLLPSEIAMSSLDDQFLQQLRTIIEKNLTDPDFNVEGLIKKIGMARATFFKKVKSLTGENPNHYITDYRLERGAKLLREKYGNVIEVAFAVGFSSSTYFATCFKRKFGQSPSSYQASEYKPRDE